MNPGAAPATPTLQAELARKALHLSSAALPVAWSMGALSASSVRLILLVACGAALLIEAGRRASPAVQRAFSAVVGTLLRPHERAALTGATWLALSMLAAVLLLPTAAALVALWAAAVGDGLASVVGRLAARASGTASGTKTWAGSIACALATAIGAWWLAAIAVGPAVVIGIAAAAAERPRLALDDNVRVAAAAGLAAWVLSLA